MNSIVLLLSRLLHHYQTIIFGVVRIRPIGQDIILLRTEFPILADKFYLLRYHVEYH
jgi:hypothetical protein